MKILKCIVFTALVVTGCDPFKIITTTINNRQNYVVRNDQYWYKCSSELIYPANQFTLIIECSKNIEVNLDSLRIAILPTEAANYRNAEFISINSRNRAKRKIITQSDSTIMVNIFYNRLIRFKADSLVEAAFLPNTLIYFNQIPVLSDTLKIKMNVF